MRRPLNEQGKRSSTTPLILIASLLFRPTGGHYRLLLWSACAASNLTLNNLLLALDKLVRLSSCRLANVRAHHRGAYSENRPM
jgi:hypothetical protein